MKIALCQLNPIVGDVRGNAEKVKRMLHETASRKPDLLLFSELFLQGYPPRDLLEKQWFIENSYSALESILEASREFPRVGILLGTARRTTLSYGKGLYNSAVLIQNGEILFEQNKSLLPAYDVFDESRYFDSSESISVVRFKNETLGISICEDAWNNGELFLSRLYDRDPVAELALKGASLIINISASPFHLGKVGLRSTIMKNHAAQHGIPFVFLNQVGGNDELIFDGNSACFDSKGNLFSQLPAFEESVRIVDTEVEENIMKIPDRDTVDCVHDALVLGLSDYVSKCGFKSVLLGLSGGIDSAVTCAVAAAALGKENVWGVAMPSRHSSEGSVKDARELADSLGVKFTVLSIEDAFAAFLNTLDPLFRNTPFGLAEENLQARIRGTLLMSLSNKFGHLLLTTGNKSESAVGYSTLYGDMNGGLGVISDLSKEMVYDLARYINRDGEVIPSDTITKPPSAELRPDQKDEDTLPPYPVLDTILNQLVEKGKSSSEVAAQGFDPRVVKWVAQRLALNEYKRRQAPPGLKVTPKAFGSGRRFPIAARYEW
ncbi:MAG: NAD+ synthase [Chitinispirillaceae bacterium]